MSIFGQTLGCGQDTSARQRSDHSSTLAIIRKTHWKDANDNDNVNANDNDNVSANNRGERGRNGKYTSHCFI